MKTSQLISFTGLPGAGKSSLAEAVARELGHPVFAKDWLERNIDPLRIEAGRERAGVGIGGLSMRRRAATADNDGSGV